MRVYLQALQSQFFSCEWTFVSRKVVCVWDKAVDILIKVDKRAMEFWNGMENKTAWEKHRTTAQHTASPHRKHVIA